MTREAYQTELRRVAARPKFVTSRGSISDGQQLDAVPIPPSPDPSKNLLGVLLDMSVKVTNSGTNSFIVITTKGADPLDFFIQRIRVKPDEGGTVRSTAIDRWSAQAFEQIAGNFNKRSYPSAAKCIATLAAGQSTLPTTNKLSGSTTGFVQAELFVPVGGKSCAIEIDVPPLPTIGAGTTNRVLSAKGIIATASRIINYKALYGTSPEVVSFDSRVTQSLATGGDNSILEYQTKNFSPDFVGYVDKTQVTQILAEGSNEVLINSKARDFPWLQNTTPDMAPTFTALDATKNVFNTDLMWFGVNKKRFSTHVATIAATTNVVTLELLSIAFDDGQTGVSPPPPQPDGTPAPAASKNVPDSRANSSTPTGRQDNVGRR